MSTGFLKNILFFFEQHFEPVLHGTAAVFFGFDIQCPQAAAQVQDAAFVDAAGQISCGKLKDRAVRQREQDGHCLFKTIEDIGLVFHRDPPWGSGLAAAAGGVALIQGHAAVPEEVHVFKGGQIFAEDGVKDFGVPVADVDLKGHDFSFAGDGDTVGCQNDGTFHIGAENFAGQLSEGGGMGMAVAVADAAGNNGDLGQNGIEEGLVGRGFTAVMADLEDIAAHFHTGGQDLLFDGNFGIAGKEGGNIAVGYAEDDGGIVGIIKAMAARQDLAIGTAQTEGVAGFGDGNDGVRFLQIVQQIFIGGRGMDIRGNIGLADGHMFDDIGQTTDMVGMWMGGHQNIQLMHTLCMEIVNDLGTGLRYVANVLISVVFVGRFILLLFLAILNVI